MGEKWQLRGACNDKDPETFFPTDRDGPLRTGQVSAAKRICSGCPVRAECLDMAMNTKWTLGIWGGTTEEERRELRKKRDRMAS